MASLKEVKRLKELCETYDLEGRAVLDGFKNTELASMYNGIGPEDFPGWLRAVLDFLHPSLAPVAFIHDVEWSLSENAPKKSDKTGQTCFITTRSHPPSTRGITRAGMWS